MGVGRLIYRSDSDLIIQQVMKTFDTKDLNMAACCAVICELEGKFDGIKLHHVKRTDNVTTHDLAHMGAAREPVPAEIFLEVLHKPYVRRASDLR